MKKVINIVGTCSGCGATFVALSLAFVMADKTDGVTFLEGRSRDEEKFHPAPFYEISLDKHIPKRRFADFYKLKSCGEKTDNRANIFANVNWAVRGPCESGNRQSDENVCPSGASDILPEDVAGKYIIWDDKNGMERADLILAVIDPLPSKVMASYEKIEEIRNYAEHKVKWLFNGGRKSDVKAAEKFLDIKADFVLPTEPAEKLYEAQKRNTFIADPANRNDKTAPQLSLLMQEKLEEIAVYIKTLY